MIDSFKKEQEINKGSCFTMFDNIKSKHTATHWSERIIDDDVHGSTFSRVVRTEAKK